MTFDTFGGGYIRGYTKAIQDIQSHLDILNDDMERQKKRLTYPIVARFLRLYLDARYHFREDSIGRCFIRRNTQTGKLEVFDSETKQIVASEK